jgi:tight adherence protein B
MLRMRPGMTGDKPAMLDFNPVYLFYLLIGLSAAMFAEGAYLLAYNKASYRKNINRRLKVLESKPDRESVLVQLRRERGLTAKGEYRLRLIKFNQLLLQSGVQIGVPKLMLIAAALGVGGFIAAFTFDHNIVHAFFAAVFCSVALPIFGLKMCRSSRQRKFATQFPDAIDIITRSLRAGHPVPVAIGMVAKEMADPVGSEFGIVTDEITYGADLETAMRSLFYRVGSDDLPLFVTAVAIQGSTGGNLGEILENLSKVIRERFKMRRKIKSLASEGRASALILSSLPFGMFAIIYFLVPNFYGEVWHEPLTKLGLACAGTWMGIGNFIMYRMVNFKI